MSSSAKTSQRKISKRITMNPALSLEAPPEPGPVDCSTYTVVYEERYCIGDSGDNCTPWMYVGEDTYTYCTGGGSGTGGGGGSGGIEYTTNYEPAPTVSSVQTISYNVQNPCITAVYNHITEQVLKSKLASMLQTFQTSTLININITSNNDLPANVYAEAYGDGDGTNYNIELNTDVLANCSQEFIAMIFYHEAIHVFLKDNQDTWNTTNSSEHLEMLSTYFDQITSAITEAYPSMPRKDAYAIILNCINNDNEDPSYNNAMVTATKEALISVIHTSYPDITDEADITAIASQYEEGGTKGTRSGGCHTLIP